MRTLFVLSAITFACGACSGSSAGIGAVSSSSSPLLGVHQRLQPGSFVPGAAATADVTYYLVFDSGGEGALISSATVSGAPQSQCQYYRWSETAQGVRITTLRTVVTAGANRTTADGNGGFAEYPVDARSGSLYMTNFLFDKGSYEYTPSTSAAGDLTAKYCN
jgi:hypothetical protein